MKDLFSVLTVCGLAVACTQPKSELAATATSVAPTASAAATTASRSEIQTAISDLEPTVDQRPIFKIDAALGQNVIVVRKNSPSGSSLPTWNIRVMQTRPVDIGHALAKLVCDRRVAAVVDGGAYLSPSTEIFVVNARKEVYWDFECTPNQGNIAVPN